MTELSRLIRQASKATRFRGHRLKPWTRHDEPWHAQAETTCRICGAYVLVIVDPPPNGIDIGGDALALHCRE